MKKVVLGSILALLVGCASVQPNDPVAINDALVGFTVNSQGKHWPEALSFVTPDEAEEITDENGLMKEEYRLAASRLRISALKQMPWRVDGRGRLIGIKDVLDDFNKKYIVSEDEKKVGTNLEQMRQERINRTLEKGKRIMAGEDEQKEPEVEVYTNKLTEEEKRKYGSRQKRNTTANPRRQKPLRPKTSLRKLRTSLHRFLNRKLPTSKKTATTVPKTTPAGPLPTSSWGRS